MTSEGKTRKNGEREKEKSKKRRSRGHEQGPISASRDEELKEEE